MAISKPKLTITEGQILIDEYYKSKLKPGAFCVQKKIPYHLFQYWKDRCKMLGESKVVNDHAKFLPINLISSTIKTNSIKITVNSRITIELADQINLLNFKKVLEVCIACG